MNTIIIDDEPHARELMKKHISQVSWLNNTGSFANVMSATEFLTQNKVDILFLDINMPGINGIDFLKTFNPKAKVIITTANPEFALEGFELNVVDYLVKPIRFERFYKAVCKTLNEDKIMLHQNSEQPNINTYIFIKTERRIIKVEIDEILFIEGLKDYVTVHCKNEKYTVSTNLKSIYTQLSTSQFIRINKSTIVNISQITSIETDELILKNLSFTIGNVFRDELMKAIEKIGFLKR
ncbi:MAG: LytR/AlgR family response regulator transcription factor [Sphingobacteriaceae bacterium]|jgi:DNA-binding LytR/AlgR family response regulator